MQVTFYKAKCKEEITVPGVGKCLVGQIYRLNQWDAMYWGAAFDIKNAETWEETVKMDDKSQAEVEFEVEKKQKAEDARKAALVAPPAAKKVKVTKPRSEVVAEMGAGKIEDLLAHYDLPKLATKQENIDLVLKYEETAATAKGMTPEEKIKALDELGIVKPEDGAFDDVAAIAKAICMMDIDTELGEGNARNQKTKDIQKREDAKGKGDKK